jgi:SAM-dependent methyltransferase
MYQVTADQLQQRATVLDVGCGEGYGTAILARSGLAVTGVDVERSVIEAAVRSYAESGAEFRQMTSEEIPFDAGNFDCVTAFHVIEHVEDPILFVRELARVLKPEGRAIVTTPNRELRLAPGERPWNQYHLTEFDATTMEEVMANAFRHVQMRGVDVSEPGRSVELRRVDTLRRMARLDPLGLRRFVPQAVVQRVTSALTRLPVQDRPIDVKFEIVDISRQPIDLLAIGSNTVDANASWPGRPG